MPTRSSRLRCRPCAPGIAIATAITIASLLATLGTVHAADYYVAPSGSDGASGSAGSPWLTLQHGADRAVAGDSVHVAAGHYAGFTVTNTGTAAARLTFLADAGATITTFTAVGGVNAGINSPGGQYITIDGFAIVPDPSTPFWSYAISFKSGPGNPGATWYHGNIVRNCTCTMRWANSASDQQGASMSDALGIFSSFQDGIQIYGNTVSGCFDSCIYTSNSARNYIVRDNHCHDFGGQGIHNNGDASQGVNYPGIQYNALVAGNILWNCTLSTLGQVLSFDGVQNSVIEDNLVYNAFSKGISLYVVDSAAGSKNNLVVNNTILTNATGGAALRIVDDSAGNTVFNNILLSGNAGSGSVDMESGDMVGFTCDRNVVGNRFYSDGSSLSFSAWHGYGLDAHSLQASPGQIFVNVAANDWQLAAGSPAIDAGIAALAGMAAPTTDLLGASRPQGAGFDIGAYEYAAAAGGSSSGSASGSAGTTGGGATSATTTATAGTSSATASAGSTAASGSSGSGTVTPAASGGSSGCGLGGSLALSLGLAGALLRRRMR